MADAVHRRHVIETEPAWRWPGDAFDSSATMNEDRQDPVATHVFLRIEHDTAEIEEINQVLGLAPTVSATRGQLLQGANVRPRPSNVWALSSMWSVQSTDVSAHFQWLLAAVGSRSSQLQALRERGYRMEIHCLWTGRGGYGGPALPPDILLGLADLGIWVFFDVGVLDSSEGRTLKPQA
jgi:hypothetical protein